MLPEDLCSLASSLIFNIVYIPQLYRVIKLKESKALSLWYLLLLLTSYSLFIYFSYKKKLWFQFFGTMTQTIFLITLIFFKIKHDRERNKTEKYHMASQN
jgi:uncharacterized protein with PQ loop repeat